VSACAQTVRITWDRENPAVMQDFSVANVQPGTNVTLGQHTYNTPGDHWINEDVIGPAGKSCLFVALDFLFRLDAPTP